MEKNMKIELITIKEFIEQAECYFRNYMDGLRRNAPDDFYYFLNNKYNMNDIMESIIKNAISFLRWHRRRQKESDLWRSKPL